jgi:hypothetical protein
MAKQTVVKGGTTKVRFIMLEAEGAEGDIAQIASAIQNALKPTTTIIQQRIPAASGVPALGNDAEEVELSEFEQEGEAAEAAAPRTPRAPRKNKYPVPKVMDDLDLTTAPSLQSFADQKKPEKEVDRFLVIAAWFHDHRNENAISMNHVFTCYKKLRWPSAIADFAWPLRALKKDGLMSSPSRGLYAINHIGLGRIEEMGEA